MGSRLKIKCIGAGLYPWKKLIHFQGNLKDLSEANYQRFKNQLLKEGLSEPFTVWPKSSTEYCVINGHQRLRTITAMAIEGIEIPDKLPINLVTANNEKEARRKVLALTSQYGEITSQGLYEFYHEADLIFDELKDFNFPEIDMNKWELEYFADNIPTENHNKKESAERKSMATCPECGHEFDIARWRS